MFSLSKEYIKKNPDPTSKLDKWFYRFVCFCMFFLMIGAVIVDRYFPEYASEVEPKRCIYSGKIYVCSKVNN